MPRLLLILGAAALTTVATETDVCAQDAGSVFERLENLEETPTLTPAKTASERRIVRRARQAKTRQLIPRSKRPWRAKRRYTKLKRSIDNYVASIAGDGEPNSKLVAAGFVPCRKKGKGRCVAVLGDACREHKGECEGMHLIVVVRVNGRRISLDSIIGGGFYVAKNQDDIEDLLEVAP